MARFGRGFPIHPLISKPVPAKYTTTVSHSTDSSLRKFNVTQSTDALKRKTNTLSHTTDARTHTSAWLQKLETFQEILTQDYTVANTGSYVEMQRIVNPQHYRHFYLWDPSKWDGVSAIYFESQLQTDAAATNVYAQLYNLTDSVAITGSQITTSSQTSNVTRSGDISANMPSTPKTLVIQAYTDNASHGFVNTGRLVIQQTTATKFEQYFELAQADYTTNTSTPTVDVYANNWLYEATKFDNITSITMEVNAAVFGSTTATFELWDLTANAAVSGTQVTTTSTTNTVLVTNDIKGLLVDGHEYVERTTSSASGANVGLSFGGVGIRITQSYATKTQLLLQGICAGLFTNTNNDGVQLDPDAFDSTYAHTFYPEIVYIPNSATGTSRIYAKNAAGTEITNSSITTGSGDTLTHRSRGGTQMTWPASSTFYRPFDDTVVSPGAVANVWRGVINLSMKTTLTRAHTTDSNKRKVTTSTHTTDANKRKALSVTHTTDSNKKKTNTRTHTTDSFLRKQFTKTHTTDSNKRKTTTLSHTTDTNKRKITTASHTTDANKKKAGNLLTHTTSANKRVAGNVLTHTTSSFLRKAFTLSHTTSANRRKVTTLTHTTDANRKVVGNVRTHTTDSNKKKAGLTVSHTTSANKKLQTIVTFYPSAGAVSPVDGTVQRSGVDQTFTNIRTGNGTAFNNTNTNDAVQLASSSTSSQYSTLTRAILCFDTSSLPDDAVINSVTFSLYGQSKANFLGSPDLHIAGATPASTSTLAASDYQTNIQTTSFGSVTYSNFSTAGYNDITLNASGIAQINLSGVTSFSAQLSWDILNSFTGSWTTSAPTVFSFYMADDSGTTRDPKLTVSYTVPTQVQHTTDANKRKAITKTHTTDSNKKKTGLTVSHTTDSNKRKTGLTVSHTTDARKVLPATATAVYYFNASDSGPTGSATNPSNAFDSDNTTFASGIGIPPAYLVGGGTTAPTSGNTITQVRVRTKGSSSQLFGLLAEIWTQSLGQQLGTAYADSFVFGSWVTLTAPTGGWTWQKVNDLVVRFAYDEKNAGSGSSASAYIAEAEVTYSNFVSQTATHTTDANKRKATTVTHTTDSNRRAPTLRTHTTDANKKKSGLTVSHTTSANKRVTGLTRTHTTDAFKRKSFTLSHTTSANKRLAVLISHNTDANTRKATTRTHTTDANRKKTTTVSHTTSANKRKIATLTHTTDANKRKATTVTHTTDSLLRKANTRTHTTDSFLRKAFTKTHTADANKRRATLVVHTTDANKRKATLVTHTTSANKRKTTTVSHSTDSFLRKANTRSHTTDANKRKVTTVSHTTSSVKRQTLTRTHTADAYKRLLTSARLTHRIEMVRASSNTSGTANTYIEIPYLLTKFDRDAYDGDVNIFFEAVFRNSGTAGQTAYVELYNKTDSVSVSGSELTFVGPSPNNFAKRQRTAAITLSGNKDYSIRIKHSNSTGNTTVMAARLVVTQEGNITKTQIQNDLGIEGNTAATSSTSRLTGVMKFLYEASKYDGTVTVRHDAVLRTTASNTATSGIYDETATSVVSGSEVTKTNDTNYTIHSSGAITLVDGHVYTPTAYVSAGGTVQFTSSKLVFTITGGFTKYLAYVSVDSTTTAGHSNGTDIYPTFAAFVDYVQHYDTTDFSGVNLITTFEALISINNSAQTVYADLEEYDYNAVTATSVAGSVISLTGTTNPDRVRSSSFPLNNSTDFTAGTAGSTSTNSAKTYNAYIVQEVNNISIVTFYKAHTTDALKRTLNTRTHTADANKRKQFTVTHTTDANKRKTVTLIHTTDSFLRKQFTKVHTTDALLRKTNTRTHTTDSLKRKTNILAHTTDSNKRRAYTATHTTDANKRKAITISHTTNSLLRKQFTKTHTTDSFLRKQWTLTHTTNSLKRKATLVTHTTDANKRRATLVSHTTDANNKKTGNIVSHTTNSLLRKAFTKTHTTDANKRKATIRSHSTDASLSSSVNRFHTTDANKRKATLVTHTTDSNKRKATTRTHTTDSLLRKQFTKTHTTDSNKRKATTVTHTTDSLKRKSNLLTHATDANKKKAGNIVSHTTNSLLRKQFTKTHTTDANKRKVTTISHNTDANRRKATTVLHTTDSNRRKATLRTHTTDGNKRKATLVTHTTDSLKRKQSTVTHTTDANKRKAGLIVAHTTDANKRKATLVSHTTNSLLRKAFSVFHTTSANKKKLLTIVHTTNALLRRAVGIVHSTDSFLRRRITTTHTTDVNRRKAALVSHTTGANLKRAGVVSHTTNSNNRRATIVVHNTDSFLRVVHLTSHLTDANKRRSALISHSTDARMSDAKVKIHSTDASIRWLRGTKRILINGQWVICPVLVLYNSQWEVVPVWMFNGVSWVLTG